MGDRLPFFAELEASQRASVQLVVQTALVNFAEWMRNPRGDVGYTAEAFALVPQELTRRIALRQTVDMVRVTMEHFEEAVPMLARNDEQMTALTVGILRYSRNLAFAAASGYADAAEARGAWDTRMEANVVDAVVRGDIGPQLQSQAAALNWDATAPATVLVGFPQPGRATSPARTSTRSSPATGARRCPTCTAPGWWRSSRVICPPPTSSSANCSRCSPTDRSSIGPVRGVTGRGPPQRRRGHRGHERRRRLERRAATGVRPRTAARTGAARRPVGDRRAAIPTSCARSPTPVRR